MNETGTTAEIGRQHSEIELDLDRMRVLALSATRALTRDRMKVLLERELAAFASVLVEHFAFEEAGGNLGGAIGPNPTLERRVAALHEQHRSIAEHANQILRHSRERDVAELAGEILALAGEIDEHELMETRLMQSAIDDDLGEVD